MSDPQSVAIAVPSKDPKKKEKKEDDEEDMAFKAKQAAGENQYYMHDSINDPADQVQPHRQKSPRRHGQEGWR